MRPHLLFFCALLAFAGLTHPANVSAKPGEPVAEPDAPVLVPTGTAARWELRGRTFDEDGPHTFGIDRRGRTKGDLEGVYIHATTTRPEIPKKLIDEFGELSQPVRLDKQVSIPALGRTVRYYHSEVGGGAENDQYRTEPIRWPDGHGGTLWVVITAEVVHTDPAKLLAAVAWRKRAEVARWTVKN